MSKVWSHAAMLLLGVSLSVGFYEGRRLVKNTAKALTAATSITASASRRGRDRERVEELDQEQLAPVTHDPEQEVVKSEKDPSERRRRRGRSPGGASVDDLSRGDKLDALRDRQRHRFSGARPTLAAPLPPPDPASEKGAVEPATVDTAAEPPQ